MCVGAVPVEEKVHAHDDDDDGDDGGGIVLVAVIGVRECGSGY